jgi:hypothetical protein
MTTILTKKKDTAGAPVAGDLTNAAGGAELAVNTATKRLYTKDSGGNVVEIGTNPSSLDVPVIISGTTTDAALRITQLGTGNALLVEDSTNPDSSPFVISNNGSVIVGKDSALTNYKVDISTTGEPFSTAKFVNSTSASLHLFAKSRSTTPGTYSILSSGDGIASLNFAGDDGTAFITAASITASVDGTPGTNDMPGRLVFSTTADGASTVTEAMRITSGQLVSIGTAQNAQSKLYVTNTVTDTANSESAVYSILTANNASGTAIKIGNRSSVLTGASFAGTGVLNAYRADITYSLASAYTSSLQGFRTSIANSGAGAVSAIYGFSATNPSNTGGGSITNYYGFAQDDVTTATNVYGYLGSVTSGATKWNLYMSGTASNYLAGSLGIGTTAPLTALNVNGTGGELIRISVTADGATQQEPALGFATGVTNTNPAAKISALEFDASDSRASLLFYTRDTNSDVAPTERMRISNAGLVGVGTASATSMLQTAGSSSISAFKTPNIAEVNTISATAATGTINYDITTQSVLYYTTNASGNFTVNFRGSSGTSLNTVMQTGESISATFLVTNGATAYYNSAVQVDGSSVTPKWQGGTAPTSGNASSIDSYTYVIIKTGSAAFTVLASVTKFA